jgi:hypothetical protein
MKKVFYHFKDSLRDDHVNMGMICNWFLSANVYFTPSDKNIWVDDTVYRYFINLELENNEAVSVMYDDYDKRNKEYQDFIECFNAYSDGKWPLNS